MALTSEADQGLHIANELPPTADPSSLVAELTVADPPTRSIRGTVLSELTDLSELAASEWLGLELSFGAGVDIREFGFAGPIKPLIDATRPLLGRDRRGGPADHRLHDLRIRTDREGSGVVGVRFWYCDG